MSIRIYTKVLAVILLTALSSIITAQTYEKDYQDGKLYFKFKDAIELSIPVNPDYSVDLANAPFLNDLREKYSIVSLSRPFDLGNDSKLLRTFMIEISKFDEIEELLSDLSHNPDLEYVERVPMPYLDYIPNDELYNLSFGNSNWNWHLDVVNAVQAWDFTQGSPDVKIAIVDNAVWMEHEDLEDKLVLTRDVTQANSNNCNPPAGGDPEDWSHGTHCAGLAAGHTDNEVGIASLGFNTSLIGVKATTNAFPGGVTNGYGGIQWAANNGADVISCSWGSSSSSQTEQNVITAAYNLGVTILGSAGNDNVQTPHYPSGYDHVICVASTDEDDLKSDFSNYGNTIDICAPGGYGNTGPQGLLSSVYMYTTSFGNYDSYYGTSMSTPFAAGLAGLIIGVNPDLTPDEVEEVLESTCVNIDTLAGNSQYAGKLGAGRIDAYAAVTNTPFTPVANFSTPLPYITPGTTIQFFDESAGVPDWWSWEFEGGSPVTSNIQNPNVTYDTEGVFTVSLGVENDFGLDVLTVEDYITVDSTPSPWVLFSSDVTYTCKGDTVSFIDESLYSPTGWTWEFAPATVTFVNATTANSQNPQVVFNEPVLYTVTLTATNANGSGSKTIEDMIEVEGILLNYSDDFESGTSNDLQLSANERAKVTVDERAATPESTFGLHFQGGGSTSGWTGGPNNTTPEQAWITNYKFHGFAENCNVDATGIEGVTLTFDLKQTYTVGPTYSWFRVLVNGEPVQDVNGIENFNPITASDPFETKVFDLSAFGNTSFSITLQSSCYLADGFGGLEGDNVFVDNLMITNTTGMKDGSDAPAGVLVYPNPVKNALNFSAHGIGNNAKVELLNTQGQAIYFEILSGYQEGTIQQIDISRFADGIYVLRISGDQGLATKKIVIE